MNLTGAVIGHVIDGDPEAVGFVVDGWGWTGVIAAEVGIRCQLIDTVSWTGTAAAEFGAAVQAQVETLNDLADAMAEASALVAGWQSALADGRRRAAAAIAEHERGRDQRAYWLTHHAAIEAATGVPLADPSVATLAAAERMAIAARDETDAEAQRLAGRLHGVGDRLVARFSWASDAAHVAGQVGGGAADAVKGLLDVSTVILPLRWLYDADGARETAKELWDGMVGAGELAGSDPEALFSQLYDQVVNTAAANPARAAGGLAPELALGAVGVAASSARAAHMLRWVESLPEVERQAVLTFSARWLTSLEVLDDRSHFVKRHGPQVSREQLFYRAIHGVQIDGSQGKPSPASRFTDWELMDELIDVGLAHFQESGKRRFVLTFDFVVGEGFDRITPVLVQTRQVEYWFRADGTLISAFPDVRGKNR